MSLVNEWINLNAGGYRKGKTMGKNRRSVKDASSLEIDPENIQTWQDEPPPEKTVRVKDEDDEIDEVFSDMPQNEACIELFRVNAQGGRPFFLEQMTPGQFSYAYVTENFGGGKYIAKAKYKDGTRKKAPFEIEGEPFPIKRKIPEKIQGSQPSPYSNPPQTIERIVETAGAPGNDFQATLLAIMRQLMNETRNSEMQFLEKMKLYKELFNVEKPQAPVDQAISMIKTGIELGSAAGGEGSPFWMMALDKFGPTLNKIVDTIQLAVSAHNQPKQINPAGATPATTPAAPTTEPGKGDPMLPLIRMVLPPLINGAAKNTDPELYVDFLLDQLPQSGYALFRTFLESPDWFDRLASIEPGIRFQQDWWLNLREQLLGALSEQGANNGPLSVQPQPNQHTSTGSPADSADLP